MLEVSFVRRRGERDCVYVTRDDGSTTSWRFPTYGEHLPHDLVHLVVEDGLAMADGFWGLVDQGVDVELVHNEATLVRDGRPLVEHADADFAGLVEAEDAVALLGSPLVDPADRAETLAGATPEAVAAIRARLDELTERWRALADGEALRVTFSRRG